MSLEDRNHAEAAGVARIIVEAIGDGGPLCIKCIATTWGLTRGSVEHAVATVREAFAIDTAEPCRQCGGGEAFWLRLHDGNVSR